MANIVITGTTSGLGAAMKDRLEADGHKVYGLDIENAHSVTSFGSCELFVEQLADRLKGECVDVLINNAGINIIGYLEDFSINDFFRIMDTNVLGIFNTSKALLPLLKNGTIINIVSNAAHMPMTASLAYNASKGAAHIMTLQLARELMPRHGITVFGIAPNKLAGTGMSKSIDEQCCKVRGWTMEYAREYQLKSLPAGEETDPHVLAEFIGFLLSTKQRHKYLHGTIIPYGA